MYAEQKGHLAAHLSTKKSEGGAIPGGGAKRLSTTYRRPRCCLPHRVGCSGSLLGSTLAAAVQVLLTDTVAYSRAEKHFLPSALFISQDAFPRSCRADFLSHMNSQERVRVIPNTVTGQEGTETPVVGLGRLR